MRPPCFTMGPPVSLGWDYTEALEAYEASRPRRRSRENMRLSWDAMREILSDVPDAEVRRVQRRLSRDRCQGKAMQAFFRDTQAASVSE